MSPTDILLFGARPDDSGNTAFALWAPSQPSVSLRLGLHDRDNRCMHREEGGWHRLIVNDAGPGTRYGFVVQDGTVVPDPASRFNPDDVHAPSEVVDLKTYAWRDSAWRGRPWHEAVVYELHVGTFSSEGTFAGAAEKLEQLVELGVTAVELLPIADFPGRRNWGYDGVLHYAPDASYGTPPELMAFVDRAHGLGLMVLLDVVYNHFGPDGNYLHGYCPEFFNPRHQTPWGAAINFDGAQCETVRAFYVHNALHWIRDYHFDGLRLDAVHAMADDSPRHIVSEIAQALRDGPGRDRHIHLVLENDRNQASLLGASGAFSAAERATAQWNDDLHHAVHVLLTGESDSYYADFADAPANCLAKALAEGFVYQGQPSPFRGGTSLGEPSDALPSTAFVSFFQNHDQIGNRAFGDRIDRLSESAALDAAYACLLLSPHVPMLFMGEEFAASTPFLYFCDFADQLGEAITAGRRKEFGRFTAFADEAAQRSIPDPIDVQTFLRSKLDWTERSHGGHAARCAHVQMLLGLRKTCLVPLLAHGATSGNYNCRGNAFSVSWRLANNFMWSMYANFGDRSTLFQRSNSAIKVFASGNAVGDRNSIRLEPSSVWIERERCST